MASPKPQSITLPRNFTFHYTDGQLPRTPEPAQTPEPMDPPQPPKQTFRVRRRRAPLPTMETSPLRSSTPADTPIPTIEAYEVPSENSEMLDEVLSTPIDGFLTPDIASSRVPMQPATPVAQISSLGCSRLQTQWDNLDTSLESTSRPSTSCSAVSNSSGFSSESVESFPSFGGSCTSPESDVADPFVVSAPPTKLSSAPPQFEASRPAKRLRVRSNVTWTSEMDRHLWTTYLMYLSDPTVTPFKTLPGTAPPLGVCHRVVRDAKKTWKTAKSSLAKRQLERSLRYDSPDLIKPMQQDGIALVQSCDKKAQPQWPASDSAARRRLRELCKKKPSLSAHYQRLVNVRSPSPFQSSSRAGSTPRAHRLSSPFNQREEQQSFSTRDMNVSLASSTSSTMQIGNPLSQLANEEILAPNAHTESFNQPVARASVHQKSQSLQLGLGLGPNQHTSQPGGSSLASPFTAAPRVPSTQNNEDPFLDSYSHSTRPQLGPAFELRAPRRLTGSFKRRAQRLEDSGENVDLRQELVSHLFGAPADISHRGVRSRGFSLGDIGQGAQRLSSLFTPPTAQEQVMAPQLVIENNSSNDVKMSSPSADRTVLLASPFAEKPSEGQFNTFPRNFSGSGFPPSHSTEGRLHGFVDGYFSPSSHHL